jgi:hypothetical protein
MRLASENSQTTVSEIVMGSTKMFDALSASSHWLSRKRPRLSQWHRSYACANLRISDHFDAFSIIRITNPRIRYYLYANLIILKM